MKLLIYFVLTFCSFNLSAQDWFPFPLGQKSFYQYNGININGHDSTINIYYCDSVKNYSTYQVYHFDYTTPNYSNCYESVVHSSYLYNTPSDIVRPDSIIQINDTLLMSFKYSHFGIETDSILFLPKIEKDSSWLSPINEVFTNYNFLKFTCDSVYYDTIIGNITDSIKLISIQAYNGSSPINSGFDTVQLLLSKHYGFIQFISFYKGNYQIPIIGIDSNTTKAGFQLATFSDYFHLNVGDVIIWKEHYSSFNPMNQSYTSFIKDSITNVISSSDSVIYSSTRTYSGQSIIHPSTLKHYKNKLGGLTLSTNKPISILSINFWGTNIFNDLETYKTSSIYKTSNSANNRSYIWEGNTHDTSTCSTGYFTDAGYDVQYNTYYGLTSFNLYSYDDTYSWTIEGSVINGVQIGNVWNVGLNENNSDKNELNIFPNPTNNYITVDGKDLKIIELINIQGLVVIRLNDIKNKETIDLQDLPKGIYLIKVLFNNGTIATEKVLIN